MRWLQQRVTYCLALNSSISARLWRQSKTDLSGNEPIAELLYAENAIRFGQRFTTILQCLSLAVKALRDMMASARIRIDNA
jgi:hypothetical protein